MAKISIKYLNSYTDRHGKKRLYYRKKGMPRVPLHGPIGSPEFWEDYISACHGNATSKRIDGPRLSFQINAESIRWLCSEYFKSSKFKTLAASTKIVRRNILDRFCMEHGEKNFSRMERRHLLKLRDQRAEFPESANGLIKALRQVFAFGVEYEHCTSNPAKDVEYINAGGEGFHAWTISEVELYEIAHPVGTKARLAMSVLLFTGQRRGDVITFGRQHLKNGWLQFTQQKTGKKMEIPVLFELQRIIDASPTGDLTWIVTDFEKPFSPAGFGNRFRKWCDEANLPHCSAHGLRKAAAARMAEMGCTDHEIMAITGHDTYKEVHRYTESARQKNLAESAMIKMAEGHNRNKND